MIYTVTLNPSLDYVIRMDSFVPGSINRADSAEIVAGGKGINVSTILCRLGMETTALGYVGGFTGRKIADELYNMGVCERFTRLSGGDSRINVKLRAGEESEINAKGPEISPADEAVFMDELNSLVKNGDYVVLAGSIPKTLKTDTYARIMQMLSNREVNFVVDAEGDLLCDVLLYHPFLIKPNVLELGDIYGRRLIGLSDIRECAKDMMRRGARNVLVSMGKEGAVFWGEDGSELYSPAPDGTVVNTVGAGDSMVGGFLYGYIKYGNFAEALKWGSACGAATACSVGIAERELILSML